MSTDDGGPTFPRTAGSGQRDIGSNGMTLRDWFAGQALAGMIRANHRLEFQPTDDATWAYQIADAMLAARGKT